MRVGVLALQGDVSEHLQKVEALLGAGKGKVVRGPGDLEGLRGLILPGGESTAIRNLLTRHGLWTELEKREDLGLFGTCAGTILLSREIAGEEIPSLRRLGIRVERNAYGRQRESFEPDLEIPCLGEDPFPGIFIRAPVIQEVNAEVKVLARHRGRPVLVREGKVLAATFHPELTSDLRLHRFFFSLLEE
jgi:5'-phosphate synthase pdxT subunit